MGKIRGSNWLISYNYLRNICGPEIHNQILEQLTKEERDALFSKPILQRTWVDYAACMHYAMLADQLAGKGDLALCKEAAAHSVRVNFSSRFKFVMAFTSPHFFLRKASRIWKTLFNKGSSSSKQLGDKHYGLSLTNWPDIPLHHEVDFAAALTELIRLSGGKNVSIVQNKCMARNDNECYFDITWE